MSSSGGSGALAKNVSFGDKSYFGDLLRRQGATSDYYRVMFSSITIQRFIWGLKWKSCDYSVFFSQKHTSINSQTILRTVIGEDNKC